MVRSSIFNPSVMLVLIIFQHSSISEAILISMKYDAQPFTKLDHHAHGFMIDHEAS